VGAPANLGGEKNCRRNLQGKFVSVPPGRECTPRQSNSHFLEILLGGKFGGSEWFI